MRLLISDASILIDFEKAQLTASLLQLKVTLAVPDVLFVEELEAQHGHLRAMGLELRSLDPQTVRRAETLATRYRRASRNDLLALALAEQEGCPLLTGDAALRRAAEAEGLEVHGSLWIGERLVEDGIISAERLREAYAAMRRAHRRLPWAEVDRQLRRWGVPPLS